MNVCNSKASECNANEIRIYRQVYRACSVTIYIIIIIIHYKIIHGYYAVNSLYIHSIGR